MSARAAFWLLRCAQAQEIVTSQLLLILICILLSFYFKLIYGYNKRAFYFFQFNILHVVQFSFHHLLIHERRVITITI